MEERAAIPALIFTQLCRIDEERIARGEQRVGAEPAAREAQRVFIREEERLLRVLGAKILAELVAEILRRVALGEDRGRRSTVNRAVVGRDQDSDPLARRFLEQRE